MEDPDDISPTPPQRLSKTPSWVMLGFVLGALFFWALNRPKVTAPVPAPVVTAPVTAAPKPIAPPRIATIEAMFADWGRFAVWENDTTEVALWNPEVNRYADIFEVLRVNGSYYFRSIPRFTRPLLTHGNVPNESPLQFTEPAEHRQRFLQDVAEENKRGFSEAVRDALVGRPRIEITPVPTPAVEPPPSPTGQP